MVRVRREIVAYCRRMRADRLVVGTAGNISVRAGDLLAITPSGVDYDELAPEHVCLVTMPGGAPVAGTGLAPSSELPLHLAALAATGAGAVVHTHSPAATALACVAGLAEVPSVHYYTAMFGGPVRITGYARFGSRELADRTAAALAGRAGCLLGNHGAVTVGRDLRQAYDRAGQLEWMCDVYLRASRYGRVRVLDSDEIDAVRTLLDGYGQRPSASD